LCRFCESTEDQGAKADELVRWWPDGPVPESLTEAVDATRCRIVRGITACLCGPGDEEVISDEARAELERIASLPPPPEDDSDL
jgi:hypothetical protein